MDLPGYDQWLTTDPDPWEPGSCRHCKVGPDEPCALWCECETCTNAACDDSADDEAA